MLISDYLNNENKPVLDQETVVRAFTENARTTFFSQGYRPTHDRHYYQSDMDKFFRKNFLTLHVLESEKAKEWKVSNYVPLATSYYIKGLNKVSGAIFTNDNFENSIESFSEWNEFNASLGGWYEWLKVWLLPNLLSYPNDFIFFDVKNNRFSVSRIPFEAVQYFDNDLLVFSYGEYTVLSDTERTVYYKVVNGKMLLDDSLTFQHNYGQPLFMQLGGILLGDIYATFFQSFVAQAELFTKLQPQFFYELAKAHLSLVMLKNECGSCNGVGEVSNDEYQNGCTTCAPRIKCHSCKGTGAISVTPSDVYTVPAEKLSDMSASNLMHWFAPDMRPVEVKQSEVRHLEQKMEEALYVERTGVNQSGESKKMDNYAFVQFVRPIADRLHSLALFVAERGYSFLRSRGVGYMPQVEVSVVEPVELDYLTADDLRAEMEVSKGDKDLYNRYMKQNYTKSFPSDEWLPFAHDVRMYVDAYTGISDADFLALRKVGAISENDYYTHTYFDKAMQRLLARVSNRMEYIDSGVVAFSELVEAEIARMRPQGVQMFDANGNAI